MSGLSDEQIQAIWFVKSSHIPGCERHIAYARAIEAEVAGPLLERIERLELDNKQANEAVQQLSEGKPMGEIVGAHMIVKQTLLIETLKLQLKMQHKPMTDQLEEIDWRDKKIAELEADNATLRERLGGRELE